MNIVIIGPSGSGKGTQAELLGQKLALPTLSVGQALRREYAKKSKLGQKAYRYWGQGKLVPSRLTFDIIKTRLDRCKNGVILDGLPRRFEQVVLLEEYLHQKGQQIDKVIHLQVSDREAIKRLLLRSKKDKKAKGRARKDETLPAIKNRLAFYHRQTGSILSYFKKKGKLIDVDGERPVKMIHEDILSRLNK